MKLQTKILKYLRSKAYAVNVITTGDNGSPDIVCCYRGRFVGIEVKDDGDRIKPLQGVRIKQIHQHQGFAVVARTIGGVDQLLNLIDAIIKFEKEKQNEMATNTKTDC